MLFDILCKTTPMRSGGIVYLSKQLIVLSKPAFIIWNEASNPWQVEEKTLRMQEPNGERTHPFFLLSSFHRLYEIPDENLGQQSLVRWPRPSGNISSMCFTEKWLHKHISDPPTLPAFTLFEPTETAGGEVRREVGDGSACKQQTDMLWWKSVSALHIQLMAMSLHPHYRSREFTRLCCCSVFCQHVTW